MRAFTISWSHEYDITTITLGDSFRFSDKIVRLDVLKDAIAMLEIEYGFLLDHEENEIEQEYSPKQFTSDEVQRGQIE